MERRKAALVELEREAEAAKQAREDEAERVRVATADLAARERQLTEAQAELARRSAPPEVPSGFLAGLDALASASHERRTRRKQS
jgi:phosphatidate phosphatase APP1